MTLPQSIPHVAIAILTQDHKFLMQLRDDIPGIAYPGQWAFFGGHIDPGESPEVAVERELLEEIGYQLPSVALFQRIESAEVVRHVFHAPLTVPLTALDLREGWDLGLLTIDDVKRGECYSARADQVRPLGEPHRRILLDYWRQHMESAASGL
ncbi:NUDIX hydrolase [Leptolyngbya sp. AN02str]|uniref:NUDIX hydrolase n=1 Tax=Leptolyngbya sp. AN02str TaxID=3423363 RepID=UPI003D3118FE